MFSLLSRLKPKFKHFFLKNGEKNLKFGLKMKLNAKKERVRVEREEILRVKGVNGRSNTGD